MKQTRLSPLPVREIMARGDHVVPLGPRDYERQMRAEARLRRHNRG